MVILIILYGDSGSSHRFPRLTATMLPSNPQGDAGGHRDVPYISGWWCNTHLEKYEFVNGKDDMPIYYVKNITNV